MRSLACLVLLLPALFLSATSAAMGAEVAIGDTVDRVVAIMGPPVGQSSKGNHIVYVYRRGSVDFHDGLASRVDLMSGQEVDERSRKRDVERDKRRQQENDAKRERIAAGRRIKKERTADPAFRDSSVVQRLAFWEQFARNYPEVDVSEELTRVRNEAAKTNEARRPAEQDLAVQDSVVALTDEVLALEKEYATPGAQMNRLIAIGKERTTLIARLITSAKTVINAKNTAAEMAAQKAQQADAGASVNPPRAGDDNTLKALDAEIDRINNRLKALDADYAASLANWKRADIDRERTMLIDALLKVCRQVVEA